MTTPEYEMGTPERAWAVATGPRVRFDFPAEQDWTPRWFVMRSAVPRVGEDVEIDDVAYTVSAVIWPLPADKEDVVVILR